MTVAVRSTLCACVCVVAICAAGDGLATLVARGAGGKAMAVNSQGAPFLAAGGEDGAIGRVISRNRMLPFVHCGSRLASLAFDASDNLYATASRRQAILRITPWGEISVFAAGFAAPEGLAMGHHGELFVTDPGASRVYRVSPTGKMTVLASGLPGGSAIVASADGQYLFVADAKRRIWRFHADGTARTEFAAFADEGRLAGMALDQEGNLYVARDGAGKVCVLNREGKLAKT